jgi:hypothetical protein
MWWRIVRSSSHLLWRPQSGWRSRAVFRDAGRNFIGATPVTRMVLFIAGLKGDLFLVIRCAATALVAIDPNALPYRKNGERNDHAKYIELHARLWHNYVPPISRGDIAL